MVKAAVVHKGAINMLTVRPSTGHLVTGSSDGKLKVFDMRSGSDKNLSRLRMLTATSAITCGELLPLDPTNGES